MAKRQRNKVVNAPRWNYDREEKFVELWNLHPCLYISPRDYHDEWHDEKEQRHFRTR